MTLLALPAFLVGAALGAAVVVRYRRRSRPAVSQPRTITGLVTAATTGVEVLAGYDERHEEELEARHGAVVHIDVGRLNVGQI